MCQQLPVRETEFTGLWRLSAKLRLTISPLYNQYNHAILLDSVMTSVIDFKQAAPRSGRDHSSHHLRVLRFAQGYEAHWSIVLSSIFTGRERSGSLLKDLSRRHILHLGDLVGMTPARIFEGCNVSFEGQRNFLKAIEVFGLSPSSSSSPGRPAPLPLPISLLRPDPRPARIGGPSLHLIVG